MLTAISSAPWMLSAKHRPMVLVPAPPQPMTFIVVVSPCSTCCSSSFCVPSIRCVCVIGGCFCSFFGCSDVFSVVAFGCVVLVGLVFLLELAAPIASSTIFFI